MADTSSDRSCLKPHTHAATETGETKKSGMKTKSQKCEPRCTRSHTSTSKVSRRRWIPTAISMALNSTQVSPSALKMTTYCMTWPKSHFLKGTGHPKWQFCHHLLTLMLFKTCMSLYLLLNTKEDILKNVCYQRVAGPLWLPYYGKKNTMEVNDYRQLFWKFIQVWNNMWVSKWWQNLNFWVTCPFKS